MALDLQFITAALKMNNNLERMGDLAVHIAERALALMKSPPVKPGIDIPHIGALVQYMVRKALDSFVPKSAEPARSVLASDAGVDNLQAAFFQELINFVQREPEHIPQALGLFSVVRDPERIADHSTNIAEDVLFYVKGIDVRHRADVCHTPLLSEQLTS